MDAVRVNRTVEIPTRELQFRFSRSSGPGGQNVNRRATQVELIFDVANSPSLGPRQRERALRRLSRKLDGEGRLHVVASEERTQGRNRDIAIERFRKVMTDALRPEPARRKPTRPSAKARERRLREKARRSAVKRQRGRPPEE